MKKIVPFNNVLNFTTDVCDITAISLEHSIEKNSDLISGEFYISGEYKMTDGEIKREKFNFELPFDIALGNSYDLDTLIIDIDDFRYELVDRNKLKVNIDLYIDGEILKEVEEERSVIEEPLTEEINEEENDEEEPYEAEHLEEIDEQLPYELIEDKKVERIDLLDEMLKNNKEEPMEEEKIENENNNNNENHNIFTGFNEAEKYVTYRVYRVLETDTIDKIIEKYQVTKEELTNYNDIENIKPGDKLIIPANDK